LLRQAYDGLGKGSALGARLQNDAALRLALLYEKWGKPDEAQRWRARASAPAGAATAPTTQP